MAKRQKNQAGGRGTADMDVDMDDMDVDDEGDISRSVGGNPGRGVLMGQSSYATQIPRGFMDASRLGFPGYSYDPENARIGQQSFEGVIYRLYKNGKFFAAKKFKKNDKRHLRQTQILKSINSNKNLKDIFVPVVENFGMTGFVMNLLDKDEGFMTFRELTKRRRELTPFAKEYITSTLRNMIEKLHASGYVHGDLHPGNIMVNYNDGRIYLIDAGFSTSITEPGFYKKKQEELYSLERNLAELRGL
jgi:tRNA A-37 threonylcarbamoyl transferase component Bud32